MNIKYKKSIITSILLLSLTACGTTEEKANEIKGNGSAPTEQKEKETETEKTPEVKQGKVSGDSVMRIMEQNLTYSVNGEQKENTAFLKHNDQQNYSLYVLPEYELSSEEPGKEILFLTEDDSVFTRIEILPADTEWNTVTDTTKAQLEAVSSEVKEVSLPNEDFFNGGTGFEATSETENVTAYLINRDDLKLKVTMFTKKQADHRSAFTEMIKTLQLTKAE